MGQKVNPNGLRLGVNKDWQSKWYAKSDYAKLLNNDLKIRDFLAEELKDAACSEIVIERKKNRTEIKIHTAKPGVIIGHGGADIEKLRAKIKRLVNEDVYVTIVEVKNPNLSAQIVADKLLSKLRTEETLELFKRKLLKML